MPAKTSAASKKLQKKLTRLITVLKKPKNHRQKNLQKVQVNQMVMTRLI